jgi:glycosyltransferase involved in cell wall biosynthesis
MTTEPERGAPRAMIVATNFPPDAAVGTLRTLRLVRHLANAKWGLTILTAAPDRFRRGTVVDAALLERVPGSVEIIRPRAMRPLERFGQAIRWSRPGHGTGPVQPERPFSAKRTGTGPFHRLKRAIQAGLALPDHEVSWLLPAVARGLSAARRQPPDVIYASGPPFTAHLVATVLSGCLGKPLVLDFRDPWARAPWREDRFGFERRVWRILERLVVRRADAVIFTTETNRQDFAASYGPAVAQRFHVVANGCDPSEFTGLSQPRKAGTFVLLHAGSLYGARNPATLFRALRRAIDSGRLDGSRFKLRLLGRTSLTTVNLADAAAEAGVSHLVEFGGHAPRQTIVQDMCQASALLILQPITTFSIPAKLYEYMAAGRPIFALAEPGGETARLVERSGAGLAVSADDEHAIEEGLVALVAMADGPFTPAEARFYDGGRRAEEAARVLSDVIPSHGGAMAPSLASTVGSSKKEVSQP